jgi:hypothetical protein
MAQQPKILTPRFTKLTAWEPIENGAIKLRFNDTYGRVFDLIFERQAVPGVMVILNRLFMAKEDSDPAFKEFVLSLIPNNVTLATLPGETQALVLHTQSGMTLPIAAVEPALSAISAGLADLRAILQAEQDSTPKH